MRPYPCSNGGASGLARWKRWWWSCVHELLHNGIVAAMSELGGGAAATATLWFRSVSARASERKRVRA